MTDNIYQPPESELVAPAEASGRGGSIENALAGRYELTVGEVLTEAWELTQGFKLKFFGGAIIYGLVSMLASSAAQVVGLDPSLYSPTEDLGPFIGMTIAQSVVVFPITLPLFAGLWIMLIRRSVGLETTPAEVFSHFGKIVPLVVVGVLSTVVTYAGFALLVLPGIFLAVAMSFALPLVVDRGLSPWRAIVVSVRAVSHKWFTVFGISLSLGIIVVLGALPLGIGLIWAVPFMFMGLAVTYRTIFGVDQSA